MKNIKNAAYIAAAALMLGSLSVAALAVSGEYGASAVEEGQTYTLEEMMNFAIQDEYLAYTRYTEDIKKLGDERPFSRIAEAEETHIMLLETLFEKYGVKVPKNKAGKHVAAPGTLLDALKAGAESEKAGIRMYEVFLTHDLPDDVGAVFSMLRNASANHLMAFEFGISRLEGPPPERPAKQEQIYNQI